jgi:GT2 family glycosyltransferase
MPIVQKILTFLIASLRGLWWLALGQQKKKLKKILVVYKIGGFKLCRRLMTQRFSKAISYNPLQGRLSVSQSQYVLSKCKYKPLFSIIVPVHKVAVKWLEKCIGSVALQHYGNWELILVDDASLRKDINELIEKWASKDRRIRAFYLEENLGIAGATNFGTQMVKGEFIGFLDHDDELTPDALTWMVWALMKNPGALWLYSDEDKISPNGKYYDPYFKPDFSPEFLLSNMYTCHFSMYSKKILEDVGGFRLDFEGSQDHDLALRLSEIVPKEKIIHIPRVLYHWRAISDSTATGIEAKPKAPSAGRKAVAQALKRRGIKAEVTSCQFCPTIYRINLKPTEFPKVSIIIPTKNTLSLTAKCIKSVRNHTCYPNLEIVLVDNASDDPEFLQYLKKEEFENGTKILRYDKPFNHSDINNIAAGSVNGELVLFMNNDIEIISEKWLEQLVATVQLDKSIAVAGGLLLYPNGKVQHGGMILGIYGTVGHAHKLIYGELPGYLGRLQMLQEMSGITAALALVRRSSFEEIGGFDSKKYPSQYNDVDLCIRLRKRGYRCIYNPLVKAIHRETMSRFVNIEMLTSKQTLITDYSEVLDKDPFYNPNLALNNEQFRGFRPFPIEKQISELTSICQGEKGVIPNLEQQ